MKSIALIGFMGTGKSTLGKALARRFNLPLVDLDAVIVQEQQMEISAIFARDGEERFRQIEHEALCRYAAQPDLILSPGGGRCVAGGKSGRAAKVLLGNQSDGAPGSNFATGQWRQHRAARFGTAGAGAEQAAAY